MRVIEFRVPLPLTKDKLYTALKWNFMKKKIDTILTAIENGSTDTVKVKHCEMTYDDDGQVIKMENVSQLSIAGRLPPWIRRLVNPNWLEIEERSYTDLKLGNTKSTYTSEIESIVIQFHTSIVDNGVIPDNWTGPHTLPDQYKDKREIKTIDVMSEDKSVSKNSNISALYNDELGWDGFDSDWISKYDVVVVSKCFVIDFPVLGMLSSSVESFVGDIMRKEVYQLHRSLILSAEYWDALTSTDVIDIEKIFNRKCELLSAYQTATFNKETPKPNDVNEDLQEFHIEWKKYESKYQREKVMKDFYTLSKEKLRGSCQDIELPQSNEEWFH